MNQKNVMMIGTTIFLCFAGAQARANGVTVEENSTTGVFKVTMENANVVDVLRTLEDKYGVEVHGLEDVADTDPVSADYSGKMPDILNRLLRNQNFSIVRSSAHPIGVVKVFIAATKTPSDKGTPAGAPSKSSGD